MNTTALNVALFAVSKDFQTQIAQLQWVTNAYLIVFAGLLLICGDFCDKVGTWKSFLLGAFVLALGLLGSAFAGGPNALTAALAVQGVGAAVLTPAIYAAITDAFPNARSKARAIGIWAAIAGTAQAAGPLIGGIIVQLYGWRYIFLLELTIVIPLFNIAVYLAWVAPTKTSPTVHFRRLHHILMRTALLFLGVGLLICAALEYPITESRSYVALLVVASATSLSMLAFSEWSSHDPFLPLNVATNRSFILVNAIGCCLNFTYYGASFLLSYYLQSLRDLTAAETGFAFLPFATMMCLGPAVTAILARSHPQRSIILVGLNIAALGLAATITANSSVKSDLMKLLTLSMCGLGIGLTAPAMSTALLIALPSNRGVVVSCLTMTRQIGSAFGVAVFGGLLGRATITSDRPLITSAQVAAAAISFALVAAYFLPTESPEAGKEIGS
ncbi:hypothetical protein XI09_03310 [Bradyrhizobium sp. CCBAU 11386]|nr:hypothetical protein [Bradyrhizobium sp. CCBAU 11386]